MTLAEHREPRARLGAQAIALRPPGPPIFKLSARHPHALVVRFDHRLQIAEERLLLFTHVADRREVRELGVDHLRRRLRSGAGVHEDHQPQKEQRRGSAENSGAQRLLGARRGLADVVHVSRSLAARLRAASRPRAALRAYRSPRSRARRAAVPQARSRDAPDLRARTPAPARGTP